MYIGHLSSSLGQNPLQNSLQREGGFIFGSWFWEIQAILVCGFKLEEIITATELHDEGPLSWWKESRERRGL